jgi:hypothetical protein
VCIHIYKERERERESERERETVEDIKWRLFEVELGEDPAAVDEESCRFEEEEARRVELVHLVP